MILRSFFLKKSSFYSLLLITLLSLSGCSMIHNQIDVNLYENELKEPTAKVYHLNINGVKRDYFVLNNKHSNNPPNKQLTLILSGSGCIDEQPLLGLLFKNIPIKSDIVVLQKRAIVKGSNTLIGNKCTKSYYSHNNHVNRAQDNLFLIQYLKKKKSYEKITLLGVSEGVQIAYLMMNQNPALNEAVFLANHAANSIKESYDSQAIFRDKINLGTLKRYEKLQDAINQNGKENIFIYSGYVKNWKTTFNSDKRNMGEVLSMKKNNRYLFIMGDNDELLPSKKLKTTKNIFCKNKHDNNLILYKNNSDHAVLINTPRSLIHKIIANWLKKKPYHENTKFTRLTCD